MRTKVLVPFLVLAAAAGCGDRKGSPVSPTSIDNSAPSPVMVPLPEIPASRVFGYYAYGATDAGCGWTNWVLVSVNSQSVEHARETAETARRCRQVVTYTPAGPWRHWPDTFRPIAQAFANAGVLHSVYVADEPLANPVGSPLHVSYGDLMGRIADVHAAGWKAMFTEQGGGVSMPHPPVDYYGLDWYDQKPRRVALVLRAHPEVNMLVAPSFHSEWLPDPDQREWVEVARQARVGVAFFSWPSYPGWTGAEDLPEMQAVHRQLFAEWGGKG